MKKTLTYLFAGLLTFSANSYAAPQNTNTLLNESEAKTLQFMHEEEKLARDVYRTLGTTWGIRAFNNIALSEQRHMNILAEKLNQYNLPNIVNNDTTGYFENPTLATMYQELIAKGLQSELDALYIGAYIEELDIQDLQKAIKESQHTALDNTYENLMRGSRNHLRAFTRNIKNRGIQYEAQLMNPADVEAIINSPKERGNHQQGHGGNGQGTGQGQQGMRHHGL